MTTLAPTATAAKRRLPIYDRYLTGYPGSTERTYYLTITVLATVALYYQAYCGGTVAPQILNQYGITIKFYLFAAVVGFVLGALATVLGGLADRIGRVNLVAYGLLTVGVLISLVQPHMPNKWAFVTVSSLIGLIEGVILVATPALMRDFSPRMGRATAMGFWTLGPVLGSLVAAEVSSHTLDHLHAWQDQFVIAGVAGLVVGTIVVLTLKELSPALRDQVMVTVQDRAVVDARARGIDVEASMRNPWKQMVTGRIVTSALAISLFLMLYYVLVGALVIYLETDYLFSASKSNSVANWIWLIQAISLVFFGIVSDLLRVRKPLMIVGGIGSLIATIVFISYTTQTHTSAHTITVVLCVQAAFGGMVFSPWMAGFTETVEDRNPALVATGLAVSGGVLRVVVAVIIFLFPFLVPAVTPLVDYGPQVQQYAAAEAGPLRTAQEIKPATMAGLMHKPPEASAIGAALAQVQATEHIDTQAAIARLTALAAAGPQLQYLEAHGPSVLSAAKKIPNQWHHWFLVTALGQILFIPLVFAMIGPWTPAAGRRRDEEQERRLQAALADGD